VTRIAPAPLRLSRIALAPQGRCMMDDEIDSTEEAEMMASRSAGEQRRRRRSVGDVEVPQSMGLLEVSP
jgi:hypothetical protein